VNVVIIDLTFYKCLSLHRKFCGLATRLACTIPSTRLILISRWVRPTY